MMNYSENNVLNDDSQLYSEIKKPKRVEKKAKLKSKENPKKNCTKILPNFPTCKHVYLDKGFRCDTLKIEDITDFQKRFCNCPSKIQQDIFILRHCAVSAPKRCRSKDGIPRKSHIVHFYIARVNGSLVPVCCKSFTETLGLKKGRVKGVITRYIETKKIPTENRGGDRKLKKFQRKFHAVHSFMSNLQGTHFPCGNCGTRRTALPPDQDVKKLWRNYNSKTSKELNVVESYFRNIFTKHFNFCFHISSENDKDFCNECITKDRETRTEKNMNISDSENLELKMLEMSFPHGEHYLFAPLPKNRDPIVASNWQDGDKVELLENDADNEKIDRNKTTHNCSVQDNSIHDSTINQVTYCVSYSNQMFHNEYPKYDSMMNQSFPCANIFVSSRETGNVDTSKINSIPQHSSHSHAEFSSNVFYHNHDQIGLCNTSNYLPPPNNWNDSSAIKMELEQSSRDKNPEKNLGVNKKSIYKCFSCKFVFSNEHVYNQHRSKHITKEKLECDTCNKKFSRSSSLKSHMKIHDIKKHNCNICPAAFNHLMNLQIHMERQHNL